VKWAFTSFRNLNGFKCLNADGIRRCCLFVVLISSIAGSGGVLTLRALLWVGLAPLTALAANKVQSSVGTLSSTWNFSAKDISR